MKRWIAFGMAAVMLFALSGCGGKKPADVAPKAYALPQAVYPEMAPYPEESGGQTAYEKWWEGQSARRKNVVDYAPLQSFFVQSMGVFLGENDGKNKVCSPLNVYMALSMLAELTDGESREEILELLGSEDMDALRQQAQNVWNTHYCADGATTTLLANSLWMNEDVQFKEDALERLAGIYRASSYQGRMGSAELDKALQDWLNAQTMGLLSEQVKDVTLEAQTVLALASTIAFQAKWDHEFSASDTAEGVFHAAAGDVTCDFLHQDGTAAYYWGETFGAVSKRFEGGETMWFFLPDEGVTAETLATDEAVAQLLRAPYEWENCKSLIVNFSVPKFDVTSQLELSDGLKMLGVEAVFDAARADFSPVTEKVDNIAVSRVQHDARVMIDEEGCTAVAYTVIPMAGAALPPKEEMDFVLDRPFFFVITGIDGAPLFAGVVNSPD